MVLKWEETEWGEYYSDTNYSAEACDDKKQMVLRFLETSKPKDVWDMGANDGTFSRLASNQNISTISFDMDPACVENNYIKARKDNERYI